MKDQGGNVEIYQGNGKGEIVPLNVAEEISSAWNSIKSIDEIGINPMGFGKLVVIGTLTPFLCDDDKDELEFSTMMIWANCYTNTDSPGSLVCRRGIH